MTVLLVAILPIGATMAAIPLAAASPDRFAPAPLASADNTSGTPAQTRDADVAPAAPAPAGPARPVWEFGLGAGLVLFDDYRGANTSHAYPLPVPYFLYRGQFLRSDQDGVRGRFLRRARIEINLSVNGTTPVRSNSARHGMPDLRSTLEVGASINTHLWRSDDRRARLDLRLPARAAFTAQAAPRYIGVFAAPQLDFDLSQQPDLAGWQLGLLTGPLFATRRYNSYFYSVAPQYATAGRPAYDAPGGYAGTQALISVTRRFTNHWVGAYVRHDWLAGAAFADSPLIRRDSYWSGGVAFVWILARSARTVEAGE